MKTRQALFACVAIAGIVAGCSDSDSGVNPPPDDGVTVADLVGSWQASSHTFTNNANPAETIDIIANGGETRSTVLTGGGVRTWVDFGDFHDEFDAQITISGSSITTTPVEASRPVRTATFTLVGTTFTTTNVNSSFDFTLTGAPEVSATEVIVWQRQ